jgi:hypothetical protein
MLPYGRLLSTDEVSDGGAMFSDLRPPSINANGAIAFEDGFGSAIYTTAQGRTAGTLIRAVRAGDVPPGILGSFGAVAEPSLNDDGSFCVQVVLVPIARIEASIYSQLVAH